MRLNADRIRRHLADFDFARLFTQELGWDRYGGRLDVPADGRHYVLDGIAEKRGMVAFVLRSGDLQLPDYATRREIERQVARSVHEHLILYVDGGRTIQLWQWVRREPGKPSAVREHIYRVGQTGEALIQRLDALVFDLDEEAGLTLVDVTRRARAAFDVERVTKRFYDRFKSEHDAFLGFITGLRSQEDAEWYASLMLNRLMFVYFIQKKGFLDGDPDYLRHRLEHMRQAGGPDRFLSFYRHFLLRLFHEGLGQRTRRAELDALVGKVPYLNGGLFDVHELERENPDIEIPDRAFERLFDFFDSYQWHLDDRPLRADDEINPDVLGYIFEKYINQKQMGAYYTKEDITDFISVSTVVSRVFERLADAGVGFDLNSVSGLLATEPERYIHAAIRGAVETESANGSRAGDDRNYYLALRQRLADDDLNSFADLITLNLNLRQLTQDVVESCDSPGLLACIYRELQALSVLDPTCGSGAFLFAVLNILEPLYEAALERMEAFVLDAPPGHDDELAEFRRVIEDARAHPNRDFFVLKTIVVNNLYGVDIMEEAVEICKLRLFLKLVSQVDRFDQVEPLPDIDFNIRAGNALVGFETLDHVRRSIEGAEQTQLDVHGALDRITDAAAGAQAAADHHRALQLAGDADDGDIRAAKEELRERLNALGDELDRYLAQEYGIDVEDADEYEHWLSTHEPFHWAVEFFGVMNSGGFDVVIGNPPWREYAQVRGTYTIRGYRTERCNNLHAFCTERALALRSTQGYASFIVQLPMVSARRMASVRAELRAKSSRLWIPTFDDRPGKLFEGLENCRSAIFISRGGSASDSAELAVTGYQRWTTVERPLLFGRLRFTELDQVPLLDELFPKLQTPAHARVFSKLASRADATIAHSTRRAATPYFVFYQESARYWVKATVGLPFYARNGAVGAPPHGRYLYLDSERQADVVAALLNSSLFYLYFIAYGDCFHVSGELVGAFPVGSSTFADDELVVLSKRLMQDIAANADSQMIQTRAGDRIEYAEFNVGKSKPIIDEIDAVLGRRYDFDDEELRAVQQFDLGFRLGTTETQTADSDVAAS
jgi:hypothetical protein